MQDFIIPAIDIIDGKCVRLSQGDYNQKKVYNEYPLEVAKAFEAAGIKRLHLVDLDGAKAGKVVNWKVLEQIAANTGLIIDFGGGVKSFEDVDVIFNSGSHLVTIGSLAVKNSTLFHEIVQKYGANKVFLGADVKDEFIAINGWLEKTDITIADFIQQNLELGVQQFFCTDIAKDGMMEGPSLELYAKLLSKFPGLQLTASGGVTGIEDLKALKSIGMHSAIVGKAIYEGNITLDAVSKIN